MTIEALAWAFAADVDGPTDKAVLLVLANCTDKDSMVWVSASEIAKLIACSEQEVRSALARMEGKGFVRLSLSGEVYALNVGRES